jgi:hypothetical protein
MRRPKSDRYEKGGSGTRGERIPIASQVRKMATLVDPKTGMRFALSENKNRLYAVEKRKPRLQIKSQFDDITQRTPIYLVDEKTGHTSVVIQNIERVKREHYTSRTALIIFS